MTGNPSECDASNYENAQTESDCDPQLDSNIGEDFEVDDSNEERDSDSREVHNGENVDSSEVGTQSNSLGSLHSGVASYSAKEGLRWSTRVCRPLS